MHHNFFNSRPQNEVLVFGFVHQTVDITVPPVLTDIIVKYFFINDIFSSVHITQGFDLNEQNMIATHTRNASDTQPSAKETWSSVFGVRKISCKDGDYNISIKINKHQHWAGDACGIYIGLIENDEIEKYIKKHTNKKFASFIYGFGYNTLGMVTNNEKKRYFKKYDKGKDFDSRKELKKSGIHIGQILLAKGDELIRNKKMAVVKIKNRYKWKGDWWIEIHPLGYHHSWDKTRIESNFVEKNIFDISGDLVPYTENDTVHVTLSKNAILSFGVNDIDHGFAFELDKNKQYRLAISSFCKCVGNEFEIVST